MSTDSSLSDSICAPCANCGKGEEKSDDLKACTACIMVKYCNRECQIAHRPQHKKACKKRAAELHEAELFKDPPPPEECPICMLPLPLQADEVTFYSCCGKNVCIGCIVAMLDREGMNILCAYCRTPPSDTDEETIGRVNKLTEKGNGHAFYMLASYYAQGILGLPQDEVRANELYLKAGELGCADAYYNLGNSYYYGRGVEVDKKKLMHYHERAAMKGHITARHNLGMMEGQAGNNQRAYKHLVIAARAGNKLSLDRVKKGYMHGQVTKEEYANTLREYQKSRDEMKSDARVTAAEALQINPPIN